MTSKEAIEYGKKWDEAIESRGDTSFSEARQFLSLAIRALMAYRDCKHCVHNIKVGNMRGCALWDCDFEDMRGKEE